MIDIQCNASPFVFKPILQLLNELDYSPVNTQEGVTLNFLNPFDEEIRAFKKESHLTDSQSKEEQIRYLGNLECDRKIIHLAYSLRDKLENKQVIFRISPHFEAHQLFNLFVKYLKQQANCDVLFSFEKKEGDHYSVCETSDRLEQLVYSSEIKRIENAQFIFDSAMTSINAGDYFSAINLLRSISGLKHEDIYFETDILCQLAICHGAIGELKTAIFYWTYVLKHDNLNHRKRASYALGLMYLRHLPKQFQDLELGETYLNTIYEVLLADQTLDPTSSDIAKVFNRNGYALAAFKRGNIDEAETLVSDGIKTLEEIGNNLSMFHQSVLYYNLAQCHKANNETEKVEKTLEKLIEIDERFCLYHEYLIGFYLENDQLDKAMIAVENGIKVNSNHISFQFLKGKILLLNGDKTAALPFFERAYELNPLDTGTLAYLTSIYNSFEDFQKVLDCLKNFHFKFSNDENGELIINNLVIALLNVSDDETSVERLMTECINLKPESEFFAEISEMLKEEYVD